MCDWLKELKIGDEVIIEGRYRRAIVKVENTTKTQIVAGGSRFRKHTGKEVGSDAWHFSMLGQATEEVKADIREKAKRQRLISRINAAQWKDVDTVALEKIVALLPQEEQK